MIRPFNGEEDLVAWRKKLKLVANLQKIDLASFIPVFLAGNALDIYFGMSEEDQLDEEIIEVKLKEAYEKLKKIKWIGESVDMYANNIKRLPGYMGRGLDQTAKLTFVTGFPESVSMTLQQLPSVNKMEITDLIPTARIRIRNLNSGTVGVVIHSEEPTDGCQWPHRLRDRKVPPRTKIMCYNCKKFGHIARYWALIRGRGAFVPTAVHSTS